MEKQFKGYENYPLWTVFVFNFFGLSLHAAGLYLLYQIHAALAAVFFVYIAYLEASVYREGCRYCYYYGRLCASGRGKLAKLFFKKGNPAKFSTKTLSWKDFLPSFLENIVVFLAGVYLLLQQFSLLVLALALWPIVAFVSNQFTFGELGCPHCRQAELGCPACEFFKKQAERKQRPKKASGGGKKQ